ncbi:hypothetical protein MW887_003679 [Aspergillus wentii]|nr:hypothetical protein MW887_003679 [Aspergillus wentii]
MSFDNSLQLARQFIQTALSHLPEPAQHALQTPLAQKTITGLVALGLLRQINSSLSHWSLNNWQRALPWKGDKELVLITGGSSGIGKQIVEDLSKAGVRVVILDIQDPSFKLPSNVTFYKTDITNSAAIKTVADQIRANQGEPTVIVNNAGVGYDGTILDEPEAKIRLTFEVNTMAHFWTVREFLPNMIKNNHGHIITVASMASFVSLGEMADYSCSKASALAFHEVLNQELRHCIIHPLWVRTPMIQQLSDAGKDFKQPIMTPELVSNAVVKQILTQSSGQVILPAMNSSYSLVRAFPSWMQEGVRGIGSGILKHMRNAQPDAHL